MRPPGLYCNQQMIVLAFVYMIPLILGCARLVIYWANGGVKGIPELRFTVLGMVIPVATGGMSMLLPWFSLLLPSSLFLLYILSTKEDGLSDKLMEAQLESDLTLADRRIREDPKNAAAYWARGRALESMGKKDAALESYRRAHEMSSHTISRPEWEHIQSRLEDYDISQKNSSDLRAIDRWEPIFENIFLSVGILLFSINWLMALNLCSLMFALKWLRTRGPAY